MTYTLNLSGESPAELRAILGALASMPQPPEEPSVSHTPAVPHPAQPQSETVTPPDKPKAPAPARQKKAAQKPAAAPEKQPEAKPEERAPANPTVAEASASPSQADTAPASSTASPEPAPKPDPAALDKIRDLARSLIVQGRSADVRSIVTAVGAKNLSTITPEHYPVVWEKLAALSAEVDQNAAD